MLRPWSTGNGLPRNAPTSMGTRALLALLRSILHASCTIPTATPDAPLGANLLLSAGIFSATNLFGFVVATFTQTHKITDLIGTGSFALSAWATLALSSRGHDLSVVSYHRPLFLTIAATCWSVRLAGYLFYRILQTGKDNRFDGFYKAEGEPWFTGPTKYPFKLLGFWAVQALWGFTVLLPVTVAQAHAPRQAMGAWGWAGFGLFMFFWAYEATADFQKTWFKNQPGNSGQFMHVGLFSLSQFPNYFAEICCWWSMFAWAAFPALSPNHLWVIVSPLFTTVLLRWGSGVANLQASQEKRYGDRQDYRDYVASTPLLFPFMKPFYAGRKGPKASQGEDSEPDTNLVAGQERTGSQ